MSLLFNLGMETLGGLLKTDKPTLESSRCLNTKQRKINCTDCADACPKDVFGEGDPNWEHCINCNLCVSACRTRALRPSSENLGRLLDLIESSKETVVFSCPKSSTSSDMRLRCLASVPWEILARIALDHRLILDTSCCAECQNDEARALLLKSLASLRRFLGDSFYAETVSFDAPEQTARVLSRREALSLIFDRGRQWANDHPPEGSGDSTKRALDGLAYARMLESRLSDAEERDDTRVFTLDTPEFSDACWGCGICAKVCPSDAIVITDSEDDSGLRLFHHMPLRCTRCRLCEQLCPKHAIVGWNEIATGDPTGARTTSVEAARCEKCGILLDPSLGESICRRCSGPVGLRMPTP